MLLYFSSDKNSHIFNKECDKIGLDITIEKDNCFSDYIRKNMNSLNHIEYIAIDLEHLIDNGKDILDTLSAFRMFNSKIDIIIVALEREKGDTFLGKIFSEGIYNFVCSKDEFEQEKEIATCLNNQLNNNYANAIGYKVEENEKISKDNEKINWKNIFNLKKKTERKIKKIKKLKEDIKIKTEIKDDIEELKENFKTEEKTLEFLDEPKVSKEFLDEKVNEIFGNTNFLNNSKQKNKGKLELEYIDDMTALFYYYQKVVGLYSKDNNNCVIDSIFEKEDIKNFLNNKEIGYIFKDNVLEKIKSLENKLLKGGGYQN